MQARALNKRVLVITSNNSIYYGTLSNVENYTLLNAYRLYCKEPEKLYIKVAKHQFNDIKISKKLDSVSLNNVTQLIDASKLSIAGIKELSYSPTSDNLLTGAQYDSFNISEVNGYKVQNIEGKAFIEYQVRGKVSRGALLNSNLSLSECYSIKFGNTTAFGKSVREAYDNVKIKILNATTNNYNEVDFASYVVNKYPNVDEEIPVLELCELHNIITNSCSSGIQEFCGKHKIDFRGKATMRYFLSIVKEAYKPEIIEKIASKYNITINYEQQGN